MSDTPSSLSIVQKITGPEQRAFIEKQRAELRASMPDVEALHEAGIIDDNTLEVARRALREIEVLANTILKT